METSTIVISIAVLVALLIVYYYFYQKDKKSLPEEIKLNPPAPAAAPASTQPLQLAAYERLVILADRMKSVLVEIYESFRRENDAHREAAEQVTSPGDTEPSAVAAS